jgi:hypothetical protein
MRRLTHSKIQHGLENGEKFVQYVLKSLGLSSGYTLEELRLKFKQDLVKMNFLIEYHDSLPVSNGREVPSFTKLNGDNRKAGGIIMLNNKFPANFLRQALLHEYAHIKDEKLPIYTTDRNAFNSLSFFDRFYMEYIEYLADMDAYSLLMITGKIKKQLLGNSYNIEEMLKIYGLTDRNSLLQWIVINNQLPCHWMHIILEKDKDGNILHRVPYDDCFYDHQSDPVPFPVDAIFNNPDTAASIALNIRKSKGKLSEIMNGMSIEKYICYAYYESDVSREIIHNMLPHLKGDYYDRLLVIGWTQDCYNMILGYQRSAS